jgi:hypothetical protein
MQCQSTMYSLLFSTIIGRLADYSYWVRTEVLHVSGFVPLDLWAFFSCSMMTRIVSFEREQSFDYFDILKELSFLTNYIHICFCFSFLSVICVFLSFFHFLSSHHCTFVFALSRSNKHWYWPRSFLFLLRNNIYLRSNIVDWHCISLLKNKFLLVPKLNV